MKQQAKEFVSYITNDLKYRIFTAKKIPSPLTLSVLSDEYKVSFTPIRSAILQLIEEKILIKGANGRLSVNSDKIGSDKSAEKPMPPLMPADWDETFLKDIMIASLGSEPVFLREHILVERHDIGRSVIRHALSRMAGAGLLEHVPNRGWLVHPLEEKDMQAFLVVREIMEIKALTLAKPYLTQKDLEALLRANKLSALNAKKQKAPEKYNNLHPYIIEKSGNRYIKEFFKQPVSRYYQLMFDYATPKVAYLEEQVKSHTIILNALINNDLSLAKRELSKHILGQANVLRTLLNSN